MTGTIVDALQDATTALNNATAEILSLQTTWAAAATAAQNNAETVINNFLSGASLLKTVYVDPINGNDSNNGSSIALAMRTLDAPISNIGAQNLTILLLGDATLQSRWNSSSFISILGIQPANNISGFIYVPRNVSFLGTALNSPSPVVGTFPSGIFFGGGGLSTNNINFILPDVPSNQTTTSHITASGDLPVHLINGASFTAVDTNAGQFFGGGFGARVVATMNNCVFNANTPGHIFQGIAAGQNPNSLWAYSTNVTAA